MCLWGHIGPVKKPEKISKFVTQLKFILFVLDVPVLKTIWRYKLGDVLHHINVKDLCLFKVKTNDSRVREKNSIKLNRIFNYLL